MTRLFLIYCFDHLILHIRNLCEYSLAAHLQHILLLLNHDSHLLHSLILDLKLYACNLLLQQLQCFPLLV